MALTSHPSSLLNPPLIAQADLTSVLCSAALTGEVGMIGTGILPVFAGVREQTADPCRSALVLIRLLEEAAIR